MTLNPMNDRMMQRQRRRTLALLGAAGAGMLGWPVAAQPACIVTPAQTEGPFFLDTGLQRSDIRGDPGESTRSPGVPLALSLRVSAVTASTCIPLADALVEVWHCDAAGIYSGTSAAIGKRFLRGYQPTDSGGEARFLTIYPGWYPGRAIHIHFKVVAKNAAGHRVAFTSQLYFDEAVNAVIMSQPPYATRPDSRRVRNDRDHLYRDGGRQLTTTPVARNTKARDYVAAFSIGMRI